MGRKRKMPSEKQIRKFWRDDGWFLTNKDIGVDEIMDSICFGCGFEFKCERAHIKAVSEGGSDDCSNLHMLCSVCHKSSEYLFGEKYYKWLKTRSIKDVAIINALRSGINLTEMGL